MNTVFVVNELDSRNIGDQVIFSGIEKALIERECTVLAAGLQSGTWFGPTRPLNSDTMAPEATSAKLIDWIKKPLRRIYLPIWIGRYFVKAWRDSKRLPCESIVVIGGGGILMNNNLHFPFAIFLRTFISRVHSHPMVFVGISLGGELNWLCRTLIARSLRRAERIYVRDSITLDYVREALGISSARIGPDCALLSEKQSNGGECRGSLQSPLEKSVPLVAVNVMETPAGLTAQQFSQYLQFIVAFVERNASIARFVFFTTGWPTDFTVAKELAAKIKAAEGSTALIDVIHTNGIDSLNKVLTDADLVIASRLHSAILAIRLGLPALCLNISKKNSGFMRSIGLEELVIDLTPAPPTLKSLQQTADAKRGLIADVLERRRALGNSMLDDVLALQKR